MEPPLAGDEAATLLGSLDRQRATFAWKCAGLDADGLRATLHPTTMTLGGMLKHLASVEAITFRWKFRGESPGPPWESVDWDADPDWPWSSAASDSPDALWAQWEAAVADSRRVVEAALSDGGLGALGAVTLDDGQAPSLRRLVVDLIEEYARHVGHADLLREAIDGETGEDPPD